MGRFATSMIDKFYPNALLFAVCLCSVKPPSTWTDNTQGLVHNDLNLFNIPDHIRIMTMWQHI